MSKPLFDIIDSASERWWGKLSSQGTASRDRLPDVQSIVSQHFERYSSPSHPCRYTMEAALKLLENRSAFILETGTASHGTNSTILFDSYVSTFGGTVITVDSRLTPLLKTKDSCSSSTRFYCNDSIKLIKKLVRSGTKVDLIYLDSLDLDLNTPVDSALHALGEFLACVPLLKQGTILLVDDTPSSLDAWVKAQGSERVDLFQTFFDLYNLHPGKGMLIKQYVENLSLGELILHQYQMLYKIR